MNTQTASNRFTGSDHLPHILLTLINMIFFVLLTSCAQSRPDLGKQLYREGKLSSGESVSATTQGDISFSGTQFSCVNCHRRSGYGSSEGGNYVLPVTAPSLFNPRTLDRANLFKKMFKEYQPKRFTARMHMPQMRPAYTDKSLARAIREGIDSAGTQLNPLMPKYQLPDEDMANLIAYLKTLSTMPDPGVDQSTIYFATVISDKIDSVKRRAMLQTMRKFFEWMNRDTRGDLRNPNFSPHYRTEFIKAYRVWNLAVWELKGDPQSWQQQLQVYYQQQPVFAIISGQVTGAWKPVQTFCENMEIPCLFPHTALPEIDKKSAYSVYFNRGLSLEADVIAKQIIQQQADKANIQITQIYSAEQEGMTPADAINNTMKNNNHVQLDNYVFHDIAELQSQLKKLSEIHERPDLLVLWPGAYSREVLEWLQDNPTLANTVYLPSKALDALPQAIPSSLKQRMLFSYPYEVASVQHPRAYRVHAWMNSRGIEVTDKRLQFNTYYALTLVQYGLDAIVDNFSRDYLMEYIEHEAENALNPGTFPRLSLGPGQRFASKGAYIVKLSADEESGVIAVSDWIIP